MTEEYIYDKGRLMLVAAIIVIVVSSGAILYAAWPQPQPEIGDINFIATVYTDTDTISLKYDQIFNGTIDTNSTVMYSIDIPVSTVYYVSRITITLEINDETQFLGFALVKATNEAEILTGKNDFLVNQEVYANSLEIAPDYYRAYVFLDCLEDWKFVYSIRVE